MGCLMVKGKRLWETPENLRIVEVKSGFQSKGKRLWDDIETPDKVEFIRLKIDYFTVKGKRLWEKR